MPLPRFNTVRLADIDRAAQQAGAADQSAAFNDMRMQELMRQNQERSTVSDIVRAAGGDWSQAAKGAAAAGVDPATTISFEERANAATDRARQTKTQDRDTAIRDIKIAADISKQAETVFDEPSFQKWRAQALALNKDSTFQMEIPDTYDAASFEQQRAAARQAAQAWETIDPAEKKRLGLSDEGIYQRGKTGEIKVVQKPTKPVEAWVTMNQEQATAAGLPAGGAYQRSSTGKTSAIVKPASGPREQQIIEWMVSPEGGIAKNPAEAWEKYKMAVTNPAALAGAQARAEFEVLTEVGPVDGVPVPTLEALTRKWHVIVKQMASGEVPTAAGTLEDPIDITSPDQLRGLKPGTYVRRDGQIRRVPLKKPIDLGNMPAW